MPKYYLFWIGESADILCAPHCEIATFDALAMAEYCKNLIVKFYPEGQYVVMTVKTLSGTPFSNGKHIFSQSTVSVAEFIENYKEV